MPHEAIKWFLAERYGWDLEYIAHLTLRDLAEESATQDAKARYREDRRKHASKKYS